LCVKWHEVAIQMVISQFRKRRHRWASEF